MSLHARACGVLVAICLAASPLSARVSLRYGGPVGQVAEYRLTTKMTGHQVSLGQRRPIAAEAEWEVREEVLSRDPDGATTRRLTARLVAKKDPTGAFTGGPSGLPVLEVRVSPTGEVLASAPEGAGTAGMLERALASLLARPVPVMLPAAPAEIGVPWRWERDGASQENTLLAVDESACGGRARITSTGTAPLALAEQSEALGLGTRLTGSETQTSTLDLLLEAGVPLRHQGKSVVQSNAEVALESPAGSHTFSLALEATVAFDLRLLRLNGAPVTPA